MKPNFIRYKKSNKRGPGFWNKEYKEAGKFKLSNVESEDLVKFLNFLERNVGRKLINPLASVADLGTGNGRNLIYLAKNYGVRGVGYDISKEAIIQARKKAEGLNLTFETRSIAGDLPIPDRSQSLVLDMMTSHFLKEAEREKLRDEIYRILKPGGFLLFKTFLLDEDEHAKRLLEESPGQEKGTYIHPHIGVAEYVGSEEDLVNKLSERFTVHKILKSHRHRAKASKRRSIVIYAEKE